MGDAALAQEGNARVAAEAFQLWTLTIKPDHTATLAGEGGNGKPVFAKAMACTDVPLPEIRLYYTDRTILLPSEY
jgi:ABC-type dipeptide/oligopeptide/nickel transport system ATPase component